jgi:hypothetical protein
MNSPIGSSLSRHEHQPNPRDPGTRSEVQTKGTDPRAIALDDWLAVQTLLESLAQAGSGNRWRRLPDPPAAGRIFRL